MNRLLRSVGVPRVLLLSILALVLSACSTLNRPLLAAGPDFDHSFKAMQTAMANKGYVVARADAGTGELETAKRYNKDWWWVIRAKVEQDGQVEIRVEGSDRVQRGDRIHKRVLNFGRALQKAFVSAVAARARGPA